MAGEAGDGRTVASKSRGMIGKPRRAGEIARRGSAAHAFVRGAVFLRSCRHEAHEMAAAPRRAGPFHPLAVPFTTSRAAYRDKSRSYSRVLVKGPGKW
jgi:hypothetical protein